MYGKSTITQVHTNKILIRVYRLLAKIMASNIRKDNVQGVLKRRVKVKEIMMKHLPYDICSIDAITEFVRDNRKTLYKFNEDSKPFMNAIIKTLNEVIYTCCCYSS